MPRFSVACLSANFLGILIGGVLEFIALQRARLRRGRLFRA